MLCPYCKEEIQDGALKCKHCGSMIYSGDNNIQNLNNKKSKITAGILALLLGGLGLHKFYVGSWGWGIIYILLILTFIPQIISVVEAIRYFMLTDYDFQKKVGELNGPFSFLW